MDLVQIVYDVVLNQFARKSFHGTHTLDAHSVKYLCVGRFSQHCYTVPLVQRGPTLARCCTGKRPFNKVYYPKINSNENPAMLVHRELNFLCTSIAGFFIDIVFEILISAEISSILFTTNRQYNDKLSLVRFWNIYCDTISNTLTFAHSLPFLRDNAQLAIN